MEYIREKHYSVALLRIKWLEEQLSWTKVEDGLPEGECLLLHKYSDSRFPTVIRARYVKRWTEEASVDAEDCYEYSEEKDQYYYNEGWVECVEHWDDMGFVYISPSCIPIEWMPIPKPLEQNVKKR